METNALDAATAALTTQQYTENFSYLTSSHE